MRVLITGGTGYLGAAIVRAVHARGHEPVVFARHASMASLPGRLVDGDVRDVSAIRRAADGADAVIHSAALVSIWRPRRRDFDDINVGGLANVLDVARERGIRRIVYTSSFLALPPDGRDTPLDANDYQRTKRIARERARAAMDAGAPLVILYPGVVYGPGRETEGNLVGRLLRDHLEGRLPGVVGADQRWSFAFVDDVAGAHVEAADRADAAGEYEAGGENAPQMRIFEIARAMNGSPLPRRIPVALARTASALDELRSRITRRPPLVTRGAVEIFEHDWPLNSERAVRELGYHVTPLEQGIRATLASFSQPDSERPKAVRK
jgi:farnesol dehydrogenase